MRYRRLTFLTRRGCGLCDEALLPVGVAAKRLGVELIITDISTDPELEDEFHLRIPVILDRRGRVLAEGQINRRDAVVAALRAWL